jgi:hypothetical protein
MTIAIETIEHSDYLEFVVTGTYDLHEATEDFRQVLDACRRTGLKKVLVDYREFTDTDSGIEKTLYAFDVVSQYAWYLETGGHELRIAYLAPVVLSFEPGADIGRNTPSLQFEIFDNPNDAREWLEIESP